MLHFPKTIYSAIVCIVFLCSFFCFQQDAWSNNIGIVLSNRLNIRPTPDLTKPPIGMLYKGMRVVVIDQKKDWVQINHLNLTGYVNQIFLEIIGSEATTGIITADKLYFRPIPGKTLPPIGRLNEGTVVKIIYADNKWLKIRYDENIGYVARQYVKIVSTNGIANLTKDKKQGENNKTPQNISQQNGNIQALRQEKNEIAEKISKTQEAYKNAIKKEKDIIQELDQVDRSLNKSSRKLAALSSEIKTIDKKIKSAKQKGQELVNKIAKTEKYVSERIVALYKLKRIGASQILYHSDSFSEVFSSYKYLEYILNYDNKMRSKFIADKKRLEKVFNDLRDKRNQKKDMQESLSLVHNDMKRQKNERSQILKNIQNKKHLAAQAMVSLKQSAGDLDLTIANILKALEKKKDQKNIKFKKNHARLRLPVKGKVVNKFGSQPHSKPGTTHFRNGLYIVADKGEPIKAVCPGRVLYADWFKGYGNMIIIDHGDSYYTVYAHADEIFKHKGDAVELGEVVGTLGDTGSMIGPSLYFEVRHHGKPINPIKWLKES
ncbi:M23B-like peptidase [Candidatus Magnetomorum sp. HK-1]|nr:M23B-like peptidase [Candidatus Magnetomorum sp. HK-1]